LLSLWLAFSERERTEMKSRAVDSFKRNFEIHRTAITLVDTIRSFIPLDNANAEPHAQNK
jgi:hypothetical protein